MGTEIEAKMKVENLDAIRQKLKDVHATFDSKELETNVFFDTIDSSLKSAGKGLRLRTAVDLSTDKARYIVTMKGALQEGTFKQREEIEFSVDDAPAAATLFENLGFKRKISFQKRRETWKFMDCKVELDEMPIIGIFVEIEGPTQEAVMKAREILGLSKFPSLKTAYVAMLAEHLQEQKNISRDIRFL